MDFGDSLIAFEWYFDLLHVFGEFIPSEIWHECIKFCKKIRTQTSQAECVWFMVNEPG